MPVIIEFLFIFGKAMKVKRYCALSFWSVILLILIISRENEGKKRRNDRHTKDLDQLVFSSPLLSKYRNLVDQSRDDLGLSQSPIFNKRVIRAVDDEDEEDSTTTNSPSSSETVTDIIEDTLVSTATKVNGNATVANNLTTTESPGVLHDYCSNLVNSNNAKASDIRFTNELLRCLLLEVGQLKKEVDRKAAVEKSKGNQYLPENYNKLEVPLKTTTYTADNGSKITLFDQPVESQVYLNVRGIRGMDETEEEVTLDMDVILFWVDGKILDKAKNVKFAFPNSPIFLNPIFLKSIWTPDLYFEELVSVTNPAFMGQAETVILFPNTGGITYRARIAPKLICDMNFFFYPADTQECTFTFKSFSYTINQLTVKWFVKNKNGSVAGGLFLLETSDPNFDYQVASYSVEDLPINLGLLTTPGTKYSTLKFTIKIRRKLSYHITQTYVPSSFFVLVTWLCFMIPPDMFEARVGISMTTLLTLTAMFSAVRESTPTVSYVKAIDIWMVACVLFLFAALSAFTASEWVKRGLRKVNSTESYGSAEDEMRSREERMNKYRNGRRQSRLIVYETADNFIEKYLSWLLSTGFVTFVIVYWTWLIIESGYLNWELDPTLNNVK